MSFTQAVTAVLTNYVGFSGRARRSEYWWFVLFNVLVSIVAKIVDRVIGSDLGIIGLLASLALLLPGLAVTVRRLHDTGRSGWWVLIGLIPVIGWIVLLVFVVQDSKPGQNAHGPNPKEALPTMATA